MQRKAGARSPVLPPPSANDGRQQLHALSNTLASMRLRLGILAADPTCQECQGENLTALLQIADDALQLTRRLQPSLEELEAAARKNGSPRRPRSNGRG